MDFQGMFLGYKDHILQQQLHLLMDLNYKDRIWVGRGLELGQDCMVLKSKGRILVDRGLSDWSFGVGLLEGNPGMWRAGCPGKLRGSSRLEVMLMCLGSLKWMAQESN